jgi:hypothetical protein
MFEYWKIQNWNVWILKTQNWNVWIMKIEISIWIVYNLKLYLTSVTKEL